MEKHNAKIGFFLKGLAIGIAEVIPGVSGGTIAFITNIYERLLTSIKAILGPELFRSLRKGGLSEAWKSIDGGFLSILLLGMGTGVISGVFGITHLLEKQPRLVWGFFFGLILASSWFVGKQVRSWGIPTILALLSGTGIALWYTLASPGQGNEALWFVFVCGVIAISALMLPGVSGSFMLVLMGMYTLIIPSVKSVLLELDPKGLSIVAAFAGGCLLGLATFSRVLTWFFKYYHDLTMAVLTGFMIGSLNKIWPWRIVLETRTNSSGEVVPVLERSVLPGNFPGDPQLLLVILLISAGFLIVFLLERAAPGEEKPIAKHDAG
jgi:putative membrane protein